ncbi:MAG: DNA methyltransferase [Myxococcota bacterium]
MADPNNRKGRRAPAKRRKPAKAAPEPEQGARRPLSQVGGPVRTSGEPELAAILQRAWEGPHVRGPDDLTHGFHTYPARMHPGVAAVLLERLGDRRALVLDPFCGSGTVLVESMVAGRRAFGIDLNPLALRIAEVRCDWREAGSRRRFAERLEAVAERSTARVRGRVAVHAPLPREEAQWYAPHVLKEMAGLREEILEVDDERDRRALGMVFSAIVVKFSRQRADTAEQVEHKRIRKGLVTEFFHRKGTELVERWAALDAAVPKPVPRPRLRQGDARQAQGILQRGIAADLIVTSPPYGGTYDYAHQHGRRLAWLEMDPGTLTGSEIGARRDLRGAEATRRWNEQLGAVLRALGSVLADGGRMVLVMGDAQLGRRRVAADRQLTRLAPEAGLRVRAVASQARPDFTGGPAREEHIVLLSR